jgi:hypothetical protein
LKPDLPTAALADAVSLELVGESDSRRTVLSFTATMTSPRAAVLKSTARRPARSAGEHHDDALDTEARGDDLTGGDDAYAGSGHAAVANELRADAAPSHPRMRELALAPVVPASAALPGLQAATQARGESRRR